MDRAGFSTRAIHAGQDPDPATGDVVLPLDDATVVLPGHGPATTIGRERATNPYLAEAAAAPKGRGL